MLIEIAIGAGSGALLLALFARADDRALADSGYLALGLMLAVYVGARLVSGSLSEIIGEMAFGTAFLVVARLIMTRWRPGIGLMILFHGGYDAILGPSTGVAEWYPPLCAAFDLVVGAGLLIILHRRAIAA